MTHLSHRNRVRSYGNERWEVVARETASRWRHLDEDERLRLVDQAASLTESRNWEGLGGFGITPELTAVVSTVACVLTVNTGLGLLSDVSSILVAPASQTKTARQRVDGPMVTERTVCVLGESLLHGPVRLSGDRLQSREGATLVLHEFAHKVDMADGEPDGTPPIVGRERSVEFERVAGEVLDEVRSSDDSSPLGAYAGTNRAELFAVATEAFFMRPAELRARFGDLYDALADFYKQDPASAADDAVG